MELLLSGLDSMAPFRVYIAPVFHRSAPFSVALASICPATVCPALVEGFNYLGEVRSDLVEVCNYPVSGSEAWVRDRVAPASAAVIWFFNYPTSACHSLVSVCPYVSQVHPYTD